LIFVWNIKIGGKITMKKFVALLLAMMMVFALCACGGSDDAAADTATTTEAAAPADAPEGAVAPPEGADLGDPTGEPVAQLVEPDSSYSKDLDGYKAYVIDALKSDEHAPADIVESTIENINAATDGNDDAFEMMISQGLVLNYDEFIAY
jgi:uncharacterized lipoprotein YehR (DUF1307 family)